MRHHLILVAVLACSCSTREHVAHEDKATVVESAAPHVAAAAQTVTRDDADDVAEVLRALHPIACRIAAAEDEWSKCHDESKGFAKVLTCSEASKKRAIAAKECLPMSNIAKSECGRQLETAIRSGAESAVRFYEATSGWLRSNGRLRSALASKPIADACDTEGLCDDMPSRDDAQYAPMGYEKLQAVECTKALFQCGGPNDVCWASKVAARLSVACEASENSPDRPLRSRRDGHEIR